MNELIEELKKDSRLKGIDINSNNAIDLSNYLFELDNCANCKSLDCCKNTFRGMTPHIVVGEIHYHECQKLLDERMLDKVNSEFALNYLKDASFDTFRVDTEARQKVLNYAKKFVNKKEEKGLYLVGKFASGKTFFLSALANELSKNGVDSIIVFMPDLSRFLKNTINDNSLEGYVEKLKNIDVLMLDDLGGEMQSPWLRDEVLMPVLQHRLVNNKPVFISSNLDYQGLERHYSETKADIDSTKANRILERIKQMTKRVKFE